MIQTQIQKLRLKQGWSQQQLADACGLSARTIQRVEAGHPPSVETLKSLAAVFELDYSTLQSESTMPTTNTTTLEEENAFREVAKLKGFYRHLLKYIIINLALNLANLLLMPHTLWAPFVSLFWGLGLAGHALSVFKLNRLFGPEWEKRQVEKRLGRPL